MSRFCLWVIMIFQLIWIHEYSPHRVLFRKLTVGLLRTWFIADYEVTDPSHSNDQQYFTMHPCKVCAVQFVQNQAGERLWSLASMDKLPCRGNKDRWWKWIQINNTWIHTGRQQCGFGKNSGADNVDLEKMISAHDCHKGRLGGQMRNYRGSMTIWHYIVHCYVSNCVTAGANSILISN